MTPTGLVLALLLAAAAWPGTKVEGRPMDDPAAVVPRADERPDLDLRAFVEEWRAKSVCLNFRQVWRDTETDELVDFGAIVDDAALAAASQRAERQYLEQIQAARDAYAARQGQAGVPRADAHRVFYRSLAKNDLYYLGKYILGYSDAEFHLHWPMCGTMADLPPGYRGLREFPRDTFKTTFMGISFCVQQVLRDPGVRILYKSNAEGNAAKKVTEAKKHFCFTKRLQELFPEHVPHNKAEEGSNTEWTTPERHRIGRVYEEATFTARGVGSKSASQHYDWIVGDDYWDENAVTSPDVMAKTRREFSLLEYLLVSPARGRIVMIGTRFAHDDLTVDLLRNPAYHCVIVSGITAAGRSLFPAHITLRHMYGQAHGQEGSLYVFSCQVMLHPTEEAQGFKREWFRYQRWAEIRAREERGEIRTRRVVLTDAAQDGAAASDNAALAVIVITSDGHYCLVDATRDKLEPSAFVDEVCRIWDRWGPDFVVRQKTGFETGLMSFFRQTNSRREREGLEAVRFYDYSLGRREKKRRITASMQPRLQRGEFFMDPDLPQLTEIEREFLAHPTSALDDFIDALSELDDPVVSVVPDPPVHREAPPETYERSYAQQAALEDEWRRSVVTDYFAARRTPARPGVVGGVRA